MPLSECACEWDGPTNAPIMRKACTAHLMWRNAWAQKFIADWMTHNGFSPGHYGATGELLSNLADLFDAMRDLTFCCGCREEIEIERGQEQWVSNEGAKYHEHCYPKPSTT